MIGIHRKTTPVLAAILVALVALDIARAADWPTWGGTPGRNMISHESGLPDSAVYMKDAQEVPEAERKNVKWIAKLGTETFGNATVAAGRIYVGTNNAKPRNPAVTGEYGVVMCFNEADGKFIWQLLVPKHTGGINIDYPGYGLCSSPSVDGERVYVVTNRCEVVCLDVAGLANGNDGDFKDEAQYIAGPGNKPLALDPADADILWRYDMRTELGIYPHQMTSSAVLVVGERIFVNTSNGVDFSKHHIPFPKAPVLICLDKKTGKLLGQEASGISARTLHGNYTSPAYGVVGGKPTVVFGGGDGFCYGFDPEPMAGPGGTPLLRQLWSIDCNPREHRIKDGKELDYHRDQTEAYNEIVATPVVHDGKVYVATGRDPEHATGGVGCLNCIEVTYDANGNGKAAAKWRQAKMKRSISTVAISGDGLLFIADADGFIYCIDAATGQQHWTHDAQTQIWGSPLLADGKVYIGGESAELLVLQATRQAKVLGKIECDGPVFSSAIAANGVLYVTTGNHLCAFVKK